ncbi:stromal interaction molecule 2 [Tachysurus ichikawai]
MSQLSGLALVLRGLFICALVGLELIFSGALAASDTTIVSPPGKFKASTLFGKGILHILFAYRAKGLILTADSLLGESRISL